MAPDLPPLWLFTDARRLRDPRAAVARLPRGLAGVVLRHDGEADRAALGRDLARICRARRLALVVAGDVRLAAALRAGVHLRAGRWPGRIRMSHGPLTSSAHNVPELRRARRAGADLAFLSPAFATASHAAASGLGALRWAALARRAGLPVAALGGIDGDTVRRLPHRLCAAAGAIGALA
jgi:thiamine-phosphate pyrophosphorylase